MSDSFVTRYTMAHQAPLSMGFSRQEYWSGLSFPSPGDLPDPEIETGSPALQAESFFFFAGRFFMAVSLCKPQLTLIIVKNSMSLFLMFTITHFISVTIICRYYVVNV